MFPSVGEHDVDIFRRQGLNLGQWHLSTMDSMITSRVIDSQPIVLNEPIQRTRMVKSYEESMILIKKRLPVRAARLTLGPQKRLDGTLCCRAGRIKCAFLMSCVKFAVRNSFVSNCFGTLRN